MTALLEWFAGYNQFVLVMGVNVILSLGLWLTLTHNVEAFANVGFMAIGAYTAVFVSRGTGIPLAFGLIVAGMAPALIALALGAIVLRLHGMFLALATVAFGEVVRNVILNWDAVGGSLGISGIPAHATVLHELVVAAIALALIVRLMKSPVGRALAALRQDELAAAANGVPIRRYKLALFAAGAFLSGVAGGMSAFFMHFVSPNEFAFSRIVDILTFVVVGGLGSPWGAVLGAVVMSFLMEFLRWTEGFQVLIEGLILLLMILFFPDGLHGLFLRARAALGHGRAARELARDSTSAATGGKSN